MREFLRVVGLNIADELEDNIGNDILKGLLAHEAVLGSNLGPRSPGSVLTLLYKQAIQEGIIFNSEKFNYHEFIPSLEKMCLDQGIEIRKNAGVKTILTDHHNAKGVRLENDEEIYEGEFKNNKKHGMGTLLDKKSGDIIRGEWKNDKLEKQ